MELTILEPLPVCPFPPQVMFDPAMQELSAILNESPEQTSRTEGLPIASGASFIPNVLPGKRVTVFPQASVTVGEGTAIWVIVSQYQGQLGRVRFRTLEDVP